MMLARSDLHSAISFYYIILFSSSSFFFFFNDTATTEIYTLSLHDALPIWLSRGGAHLHRYRRCAGARTAAALRGGDRKSTRLNSSHLVISYAVFCLKKKKKFYALIPRYLRRNSLDPCDDAYPSLP